MSDMRSLLERRARQYRPQDDGYEAFLDRADRRHRNHRIATIAVALVVALVGSLGVYSMLSGSATSVQTAGGRFAIWPQQKVADAEVAQSRANAGDHRLTWQQDAGTFMEHFVNEALSWKLTAFSNETVELSENGPFTMKVDGYAYDDCTETLRGEEAWDCSDAQPRRAFVTIERLLQRDDRGIWFVTQLTMDDGSDPQIQNSPLPPVDTPQPGDPDATSTGVPEGTRDFVLDFVDARKDGSETARDFLAPEALEAYEAHRGGLDLYEYLSRDDVNWLVDVHVLPDTDRARVVIRVFDRQDTTGQDPLVEETLLVGSPGDGAPILVLEAERTG